MKRNSLLLATALLIGMTGCKNTPVQKEAWISNALDAASYQLKSTAEELSGTSKFPRSIHSGYDVNFLDTQLQRENKAYIDSLHPNPEALKSVIPINLIVLLLLVYVVYIGIRCYVKDWREERGYY